MNVRKASISQRRRSRRRSASFKGEKNGPAWARAAGSERAEYESSEKSAVGSEKTNGMAASASQYFRQSGPAVRDDDFFEGVDPRVDLSSFPILRLDHVPMLPLPVLERSLKELDTLYLDDPGLSAYKTKQENEIKEIRVKRLQSA